jgi:hypothetical protein
MHHRRFAPLDAALRERRGLGPAQNAAQEYGERFRRKRTNSEYDILPR